MTNSMVKRILSQHGVAGGNSIDEYRCPSCGEGTLSVTSLHDLSYTFCRSCRFSGDLLSVIVKRTGRTEKDILASSKQPDKQLLPTEWYASDYLTYRTALWARQSTLDKYLKDGAKAARDTVEGCLLMRRIVEPHEPQVSDSFYIPDGLSIATPGQPLPNELSSHLKKASEYILVPCYVHDCLTNVLAVGDNLPTMDIPIMRGTTGLGLYRGMSTDTLILATDPLCGLALATKAKACASVMPPIAISQSIPEWVSAKRIVVVSTHEFPLSLSDACRFIESSRKIEVAMVPQRLSSIRPLHIKHALVDKTVSIEEWLVSRLSSMYQADHGMEIHNTLASMAIPRSARQAVLEVVAKKRLDPGLKDLLESVLDTANGISVGTGIISDRHTNVVMMSPNYKLLTNFGLTVHHKVFDDAGYLGYYVSTRPAGFPTSTFLIPSDVCASEPSMRRFLSTHYALVHNVSFCPEMEQLPHWPWDKIMDKFSSGRPVLQAISKLGAQHGKLYFRNAAYNTAFGKLWNGERGVIGKLPAPAEAAYAGIGGTESGMSEFPETRSILTSDSGYLSGLSLVLGHFVSQCRAALEADADHVPFRPCHLLLVDIDITYWNYVLQLFAYIVSGNGVVPNIPTSYQGIKSFMDDFSGVGTLTMFASLPSKMTSALHNAILESERPVVASAREDIASRFSGEPGMYFMRLPKHKYGELEGPVPRDTVASLQKEFPFMLEHALSANAEQQPAGLEPALLGYQLLCNAAGVVPRKLDDYVSSTCSAYLWNSAPMFFERLGKILLSPTPSDPHAYVAETDDTPFGSLPENCVAMMAGEHVILHKDRAVRMLNGNKSRFNRATLDSDISGMCLSDVAMEPFHHGCWAIYIDTWQRMIDPSIRQDRARRLKEMSHCILQRRNSLELFVPSREPADQAVPLPQAPQGT